MARARLNEADILFDNGKYDTSWYLCGYAIELTLKARIATTLRWGGWPQAPREVDGVDLRAFHIHSLGPLLSLSGRMNKIKGAYRTDWTIVMDWTVEDRYRSIGTTTKADAQQMLLSARTLMAVI
jgi:hypothetical protein